LQKVIFLSVLLFLGSIAACSNSIDTTNKDRSIPMGSSSSSQSQWIAFCARENNPDICQYYKENLEK
jgi:invasion protein IalB